MHQDVHDALNTPTALTLTPERRQRIRDRFHERAAVGFAALHEAIAEMTAEQVAEEADPRTQLRRALDACFYGTLTPRDPESGVIRDGHAKDGWRHGVSRPFTVLVNGEPATFDVAGVSPLSTATPPSGAALDMTVQQYEALCAAIASGEVTQAP